MRQDNDAREDFFARVAARRLSARGRDLAPTPPPRVEERLLAPRRGPSRFRAAPAIRTEAELAAELARQRRAHAPFLRGCAPALARDRRGLSLSAFDWRIQTAEDEHDFGRALRGEGEWTRVSIPHYGAPVGKACTLYRTGFTLDGPMLGAGRLFIRFGAVDYTAEVYVNGALAGTHEGFFAPFECDITRLGRLGGNTLVVKVGNDWIFMGNGEPRREGDKLYAATGPGFDEPVQGWHHCPPGMGIWQEVRLEARPDLFIGDVFVRPMPGEERAEAWVEVHSCSPDPRPASLSLSLFGANFPRTVFTGMRHAPVTVPVPGAGDVPGKEEISSTPLLLGPGANLLRVPFPVRGARAWSPRTPWLYELQVGLVDGSGETVDARSSRFGMRRFAMDEGSTPRGRLLLNGEEIRLRGANTMGFEQRAVMAGDRERLIDDILLAKICRMNFLRFTQRPVQPEVYDVCDQLGMMAQTDLPLFAVMRRTRFAEGVRQAGEMERLVRGHPCSVVVSFINEALPNAMSEPHRHLTREELDSWVSAASAAVLLENPDRVIKPHDGDYDPPGPGLPDNHCYAGWYNGHGLGIGRLLRGWWQPVKPGWHCACGEFGSEGLDPVDLMRRRYPADWLPGAAATEAEEAAWNPDRIPQAQTGRFHFMWFDTPRTLEGWAAASRGHQAWVTRLMTEALRRNALMNSFALHLFIDAFPSGWMKSIMDVERRPKPAFFAYRDALAPLMASLRTDRFAWRAGEDVKVEAWVCNDLPEAPAGLRLSWRALLDGKPLCAGERAVAAPACSSRYVGTITFPAPAVAVRARVAVQAALLDDRGRAAHDTAVELDLFPPVPARTGPRPAALILGGRGGPAAALARGLDMACRFDGAPTHGGPVICDDPALWAKAQARVLGLVRAGATALIVQLPVGKHDICGGPVTVRPTGMGEFFFASRATGHPLVEGMEPRDLFMWYDPAEDSVMPLLAATLDAPGWDVVVSTGHLSWTAASTPAQACVEKRVGKGAVRICQVRLAGRLVNPAAELLARRLAAPREES
jgi:hypothetical protein